MATDRPELSDETSYNRVAELKSFDESKSGVKGLVDSGITKVPRMFIRPLDEPSSKLGSSDSKFSIPVIDLGGVDGDPVCQDEVIEKVRHASETSGFFQVINHGIPESVLEEMKEGVRRFHEQDDEIKKAYYTRDLTRKFVYNSNFDLYVSPTANWRDSFSCYMAPDPPQPEELPESCR